MSTVKNPKDFERTFPQDCLKQAQESLAAAMSLNSIVTSWADDRIETTDSKLLQPSTGNKKRNMQSASFNLRL